MISDNIPHGLHMEVYKIILSLNNSKTSGYDGIATKVLKVCATWICHPLAYIINLSFLEGVFPDQLKMSIVKPLFKNGSKSDPNNYRPITIVPIISKIFEKAMLIRLNSFLYTHDVLCKEQFGFRKGSSTALAIFNFIKLVTESINDGHPAVSLFLDMSKAFDFVDHYKLLNKLDFYGIRGKAYEWIYSYLVNRQQCTEISKVIKKSDRIYSKEKFKSKAVINKCGVPQGSILGPLFFLLYINDLPEATLQKCILFADDTTVVIKCQDKNDYKSTTEKTLKDIISWMQNNNLNINVSKTKLIEFSSYNSKPLALDVLYNGEKVQQVDQLKFLGINVDKNLNWKSHVEHIGQRLDRFVFALKKLRRNVSVEAALAAYHGYVSSVLSYGLIMWGNSTDTDRVFKLQKRCIRVINRAWFLDSCKPLFQEFKILPLPCMYIRDICIFTKTHMHYFKQHTEVIPRQKRARFRNLLYLPAGHKDIYKKNVFNMCILIYNTIPNEFKLLQGNVFKTKLSEWLQIKCFYSIKEFLEHKNIGSEY